MCERAIIEAEGDAALGRLLALGLSAAEHLQGRILAAETDEEAASQTLAFARACRSVRQTAALRDKLLRSREAAGRQAAKDAPDAVEARVAAKKAHVRLVVERAVWAEHEGEDAEARISELSDLIDEDAYDAEFLDRPLEDWIAQLKFDLGLAAEPDTPNPAESSRAGADREGAARSSQPSGASTSQPSTDPPSAWVPAFAGTSGEGGDWSPPPASANSS